MIKEKFDLSGKTALVVGGRGFLGRRFASTLTEFGAQVYSADLPVASSAAEADSFDKCEQQCIQQLDVDVTDPFSINLMVENILKSSEKIDILLISTTSKPKDFYKPFTECSLEGWKKVVSVELDGTFLVTQRIGKVMEAQGGGNIIFISSIYGIVGNDQRIYQGSNLNQLYAKGDNNSHQQIYSHSVYNTVKGGLISFARYLAAYWGEKNIRVNIISPGGVSHPGENEKFVKEYSSRTPLGRKANIDELCGSVAFLASEASSYMTGHNLIVDGGWTIW